MKKRTRAGSLANNREVGRRYEQLAAQYMIRYGLKILEMNFRCSQGEIDLIAQDGTYLVFIEVKYRTASRKGEPLEAVDHRKQLRIRNAARYYLYHHRYGEDTPCRFDVVGILGDEVHWIRNAF